MKVLPIYFTLSLTLSVEVMLAKVKNDFPQQKTNICFTENKGQFADQNYNPRPDVLFGGSDGQFTFHITKKGISYQLYKVESYKEVEYPKTKKKKKEIDLQSIYRTDIKWLHANPNPLVITDEALPGYNNYYLQQCPNGALDVKSFKGITLQNIYNNIDLHYYEKEGHLKYDYIVAPHADYKKIQLKVEGAILKLQKDGSLMIETPLGLIQEQAPLVYQNRRQLKAYYTIKDNNTIGFEVERYDENYELIIDPVARVWGTYYGGTGDDYGVSCIADASGNVYLAGYSSSGTGTIIATTGSYQSSLGGNNDAFLVKFNSTGVRQWGTYCGGSGNDFGSSCVIDGSGNVYVAGSTATGAGTVLATTGSHQSAFGGGNGDAFLMQFNNSGVRQWGSLYGGTGLDGGSSCAVDVSGYVYLAGNSTGSTGTIIATAGSYQSSYGGGNSDIFLVKFSSIGVRQWATYYGGAGTEDGGSCTTDVNGDVYFTGYTTSSTGTVIATAGSHQTSFGGNWDAFLVKFSSSGGRLWGTYYGGTGSEVGASPITDAAGNVFFTGYSNSNTGNLIATIGSYQPTYGGGNDDAFLVKFNSSGVRQWGTYYGGVDDDEGYTCVMDINGNIYMAGLTSAIATTVIATPGSQQTYFGGGFDGYLVKFNSSGIRTWGTYYGGTAEERALSCTVDALGGIYMAGYTQSNTGSEIASAGSHQSTFGGVPPNADAFLAKFTECVTPAQPSAISGAVSVCSGSSQTYSVTNDILVTSYTWSLPSGWTGTSVANTISTTSGATGVFTLTANNPCASPQRTLLVNVSVTPTVTVNSGSICSGNNFTIAPSGATNYSITGNMFTVSPGTTTSYSVTGSSTAGCVSNNAVSTITVNATPTISVNSGSMCTGYSFIITPTGANTYTITGGNYTVNPIINTSYSVTGASAAGCISLDNAVSTVTVNTTPTVSVNSGSICSGNSFTIAPWGASTYTITGGNFTVSPGITSSYSVNGTSTAGCVSANAVSNITVYAKPTVVTNSGSICAGNSFTILPSGASTYTIAGGNFTVSPIATTVYSVTGTSTAGCVSIGASLCEVTVHAIPIITVNSGSICSGNGFTIMPSGANTYTVSGGNFIVTPGITTSYSVIGSSYAGCMSANAISSVTVYATPTLVTNSGSICSGNSFIITPSGANTYSITGGNFTVIPSISTSYTLTGTSNAGCLSEAVISEVTVLSNPTLVVNSGSICAGESFIITPSGANTYSISSDNFTVSPNVTSAYTVTGTSAEGCNSSEVFSTVVVNECVGLSENSGISGDILIYPNPTTGILNVESDGDATIDILDLEGRLVYDSNIHSGISRYSLEFLASGIYFIKISDGQAKKMFKIIKQ